jgi:GT2 family glycosyltransferase
VVTLGDRRLLLPCLESVARQTHQPLEGLVVLNESPPEAASALQPLFPRFFFIPLAGNQMYCAAHNAGIRRAQGDLILCLNDDIVLAPDFVAQALRAFGKDPLIGSVNGRLMRPDGRTVDSLGFAWSRCRYPREPRQGKSWAQEDGRGRYIFGANGAAAFYRRGMLEAVKVGQEYFDEGYGIYYEDYDLAWRAFNAGWKAYYCPDAAAVHERGASTRLGPEPRWPLLGRFALTRLSADLKARLVRNRYATMVKNDSAGTFMRDLIFIFLYDFRLWAYLLIFDRRAVSIFFRDRRFWRRAWTQRRLISSARRPGAG